MSPRKRTQTSELTSIPSKPNFRATLPLLDQLLDSPTSPQRLVPIKHPARRKVLTRQRGQACGADPLDGQGGRGPPVELGCAVGALEGGGEGVQGVEGHEEVRWG
jgi:hypothetical protein